MEGYVRNLKTISTQEKIHKRVERDRRPERRHSRIEDRKQSESQRNQAAGEGYRGDGERD